MKIRAFRLTRSDIRRLSSILRRARSAQRGPHPRLYRELGLKLRHAIPVCEPAPPEVAAIGSVVLLRNLETGAEAEYTLTDPGDALPVSNGLSILLPLGLAVLGRREGEIFTYQGAQGPVRVKIEKVFRTKYVDHSEPGAHSEPRVLTAGEG